MTEPMLRLIAPETEAVVLAGILQHGAEYLDEARSAGLLPEHLYGEANKFVLRAALALDDQSLAVDAVAVAHWLRSHDLLERVGGTVFLHRLLLEQPAVANFRQHCVKLRSLARVRQIRALAQTIAAEASGDVDPDLFAATLEERIGDALDQGATSEQPTLPSLVSRVFQELQAEARGEVSGVRAPFRALQHLMRDWVKGELHLVAARPGMGKSAFGVQAAEVAAESGVGVAFVTAEMTPSQLVRRALLRRAGVARQPWDLQSEDWSQLTAAAGPLQSLPLEVIHAPGVTVAQIRSLVRRSSSRLLRAKGVPVGLVVVDYLQLLRASRNVDTYERVTEISRDLKAMAGALEVPVIALCQLNRDLEKRKDKRPILSDLRGSGDLEQDAARVLFLYRGHVYDKSEPEAVAEAILAKNRFGNCGVAMLEWTPALTEFADRPVEETAPWALPPLAAAIPGERCHRGRRNLDLDDVYDTFDEALRGPD